MPESPSVENYSLGQGVVSFNYFDPATSKYTGERDLGNAPSFSFEAAMEKKDHFSSRSRVRSKDKIVVSQITPQVKFTLDEINTDNMALTAMGDIATVTQIAGTVTAEEVEVTFLEPVKLAKVKVSSVVIVTQDSAPVTLVLNTDYEITEAGKDASAGRIRFLDTSIVVEEGDTVEVSYSYANATVKTISAFSKTTIEGFLRFVSDNALGPNRELQVWKCSLAPEGEMALIGDDWTTLSFVGECLSDSVNHPSTPYFDILEIE